MKYYLRYNSFDLWVTVFTDKLIDVNDIWAKYRHLDKIKIQAQVFDTATCHALIQRSVGAKRVERNR